MFQKNIVNLTLISVYKSNPNLNPSLVETQEIEIKTEILIRLQTAHVSPSTLRIHMHRTTL